MSLIPTPADSSPQAGVQDANPGTSAPAGGQPNSQAPMTPEQYRVIAREEAERVWQSGKDRRFNAIQNEQQEQRTLLQRIEEKMSANPNLSFAEAKRDAQIDTVLEVQNSSPAADRPASLGSGADSAVKSPEGSVELSLLQSFGFVDTDADVQRALLTHKGNAAALATALVEIQNNRKNQPPPSPATIAPTFGHNAQTNQNKIANINDSSALYDMARDEQFGGTF